jgi:hypothetical protein
MGGWPRRRASDILGGRVGGHGDERATTLVGAAMATVDGHGRPIFAFGSERVWIFTSPLSFDAKGMVHLPSYHFEMQSGIGKTFFYKYFIYSS